MMINTPVYARPIIPATGVNKMVKPALVQIAQMVSDDTKRE